LLNQRLKKQVAKIKPNIILSPLVPVILMIPSAMRLCRFHFSIANAIKKPPMNKNIVESEYALVTSLMDAIPNNGKTTIGTSATTANGAASNTHQVIIAKATDNTVTHLGANKKGLTK